MQFLSIIIFNVICVSTFSFGQCPTPEYLGPRTEDDKSMCAMVHIYSEGSWCAGESREVFNGEETSELGDYWDDTIHTLIVREGCTLRVYQDTSYNGDEDTFTGLHEDLGPSWNNAISSYKCGCEFKPVDCVATDDWVLIQDCEYPSNEEECSYEIQQGTSIGQDISNGFKLTETEAELIREELHAEFLSSSSLTTEYDWTDSYIFGFPMRHTGSGIINTGPGDHIGFYQIQGRCGESIVGTVYNKFANIP